MDGPLRRLPDIQGQRVGGTAQGSTRWSSIHIIADEPEDDEAAQNVVSAGRNRKRGGIRKWIAGRGDTVSGEGEEGDETGREGKEPSTRGDRFQRPMSVRRGETIGGYER